MLFYVFALMHCIVHFSCVFPITEYASKTGNIHNSHDFNQQKVELLEWNSRFVTVMNQVPNANFHNVSWVIRIKSEILKKTLYFAITEKVTAIWIWLKFMSNLKTVEFHIKYIETYFLKQPKRISKLLN